MIEAREQKGSVFTQILIVIAVVWFITTISILVIGSEKVKERDEERISDMQEMQNILARYVRNQKEFPAGNGVLLGRPGAECLGENGFGSTGNCGESPYMREIPKDPSSQKNYIYNSGPGTYSISFELEGQVNGMSGEVEMRPNGLNQ